MVYWRIFGAWKKKNKSADVIWHGFDAIYVCSLIDHGQQPMKMRTEVTLSGLKPPCAGGTFIMQSKNMEIRKCGMQLDLCCY